MSSIIALAQAVSNPILKIMGLGKPATVQISTLLHDCRQLGESENALPLQIVAAFVSDLVLRAFKHCGGFKGPLYDFVKMCREVALIPIWEIIGPMRQALAAAAVSLQLLEASPQEQT